jgi:Flp pilus assembly protein CpaB
VKTALSRHRRVVTALLAATAAVLALAATHPRTHGVRVPVAARDLATGALLGPGDVTARVFPVSAVPSGLIAHPVGRTLSGPVRRGEPLTDMRLRTTEPTVDPNLVVTPVRLADSAVAGLLHPGDLVDVLAARTDGPRPARTVAAGVPVISVPGTAGAGAGAATGIGTGGTDTAGTGTPDNGVAGAGTTDGTGIGTDTGDGALIVLRTDRAQAATLAQAATDSRLSVTILSG